MQNDTLLMDQVIQCVRQAGQIVVDHWGQTKDVVFKGRIDLVTQTDLAVEDLLRTTLPALIPGSTLLAEESHTTLEPDDVTWIVDPVDGTTNYAHGIPVVAVSVALWAHGRVRLGVVYVPMLGELFWARQGRGAYYNGQRMYVSTEESLQQSLVATGFPYSVLEELDPICARFKAMLAATQGIRRLGSAATDLAYTACGRFAGFYETSLKPWDVAAGWLLVEEAGGVVSALDGSAYTLSEPMIVASNGHVHAEMLALLQGAV
ncbi:inositol monophosphatase family protein [Desulfovibrionales bacterium]